jgi:hypothetical protein
MAGPFAAGVTIKIAEYFPRNGVDRADTPVRSVCDIAAVPQFGGKPYLSIHVGTSMVRRHPRAQVGVIAGQPVRV